MNKIDYDEKAEEMENEGRVHGKYEETEDNI